MVALSALFGKNVVLIFYPADDTSGCTRQLCEFRDVWAEASGRGVEVFGVNPGGAGGATRAVPRKVPFCRFRCWWTRDGKWRHSTMPTA